MAQAITSAWIRCAYCNRRIRISVGTLRRVAEEGVFVTCAKCAAIALQDGWVLLPCQCAVCTSQTPDADALTT